MDIAEEGRGKRTAALNTKTTAAVKMERSSFLALIILPMLAFPLLTQTGSILYSRVENLHSIAQNPANLGVVLENFDDCFRTFPGEKVPRLPPVCRQRQSCSTESAYYSYMLAIIPALERKSGQAPL